MALSKSQLNQKVDAIVKKNGREAITGKTLNEVLRDMIESCFPTAAATTLYTGSGSLAGDTSVSGTGGTRSLSFTQMKNMYFQATGTTPYGGHFRFYSESFDPSEVAFSIVNGDDEPIFQGYGDKTSIFGNKVLVYNGLEVQGFPGFMPAKFPGATIDGFGGGATEGMSFYSTLGNGTYVNSKGNWYYDGAAWRRIYDSTNTFRYSINFFATNSNPGSGTTGYFGNAGMAPTTTGGTRGIEILEDCTLVGACINSVATVAGSNENWSFYVRVNNTTDYLIQTVGTNSARRAWKNSAINSGSGVALVPGDYIEIKMVNPTWGTPPTTVSFSGYLTLKYKP